MIALSAPHNRAALLAACELEPVLGAHIRTDLLQYGDDNPETGFWVATDEYGVPAAALSRINGRLTIAAAAETPIGELGDFVRAVGGFNQLRATAELCRRLQLPGRLVTAPTMVYSGGIHSGDYSPVTTDFSLEQLYALLRIGFDNFAGEGGWGRWYTYASHLLRHGLGTVAGVSVGGQLAATGGVYAWGERCGVIACLVTAPPFRGRGYGRLLVRYLNNHILVRGKTPALLCAEETLIPFYASLGYEICGHWSQVSR